MKSVFSIFLLSFSLSTLALENGVVPKNFELSGHPKSIQLKDLKGKYVVLEWYNEGCPFVRKHYDSKNIPNMQKKYQDKVSWLTIASSAQGKQGYIENISKAQELYTKEQMSALSLLLDSDGSVGNQFAAKTTPHFFIIDPAGKVVYQGGVDSIASANPADIEEADNYVAMALEEALAGKSITQAKTRPYGCSVKY